MCCGRSTLPPSRMQGIADGVLNPGAVQHLEWLVMLLLCLRLPVTSRLFTRCAVLSPQTASKNSPRSLCPLNAVTGDMCYACEAHMTACKNVKIKVLCLKVLSQAGA